MIKLFSQVVKKGKFFDYSCGGIECYWRDLESIAIMDHPPTLRSLNSVHRAFVRFINTTRKNVKIYWIDFQGQNQFYKKLSQGEFVDINTFVTHPWIFVEEETMDR